MMKVCIVGNGPSCLNKSNGRFIDSCDVVIRMNDCVVDGYEKHIGSKVDVYASRWKKLERNSKLCEKAKHIWVLYPEPPHNWNSNYLGEKSIARNKLAIKDLKVFPKNLELILKSWPQPIHRSQTLSNKS